MKSSRAQLLLHPLFLLSLCLLLLNDISWKYAYHNWFTGKLSDFAGIFAFTVVLRHFFPRHKKVVAGFVILLFCWWKSPFSTGFISSCNAYLSLPVHRVQDYTDLLALAMVPFGCRLQPFSYQFSNNLRQRLAINLILLISTFSFCYTSMMTRQLARDFRENEIPFREYYWTAYSKDEVLQKLLVPGMQVREDSIRFYPLYKGDYYQRVRVQPDSFVLTALTNKGDSLLYIKETSKPAFYRIPYYVFQGDTLNQLEVLIKEEQTKGRKSTSVEIQSFFGSTGVKASDYAYYENKAKKLRKHFKKLFRK